MTDRSDTYDIAVVGAGPAGAYLAQKMAEAGRSVALLDPSAPWDKPCGGGITPKAWDNFPILNHPDLPRNEVYHSLQITPTGRFFVIDEGRPLHMVSRSDLSRLMLDEAIAAGAKHLAIRVSDVKKENGAFVLDCQDRQIQAGYVVGADGVRSIVRKAFLGPLPKERMLVGISQHFEGGPGDPTMIQATPFPGYIWSFAHQDKLSVGVGCMEPGNDLKPHLERFMEKFFPSRKPLTGVTGSVLPYINDWGAYREPRMGESWALIGDAAGFCDTMTGEGILYAVWSADLLAKALVQQRPGDYEKLWRKAFGVHLISGAWIFRKLFAPRNIERFFSALTVCPSFRRPFLNFVWNQPPYHIFFLQMLAAIPRTMMEWKRFRNAGSRLAPSDLGPFVSLADKLKLEWK